MSNWWVTGGSGFLGHALCDGLERAGIGVGTLVRRGEFSSLRERWSVGDGLPSRIDSSNTAGVFHVAWDFADTETDPEQNRNVLGALKLLEDCKARSLKFVFISSLSAFEGCQSGYGRAKLRIEKEVLSYAGGIVVAPGLIWSREGRPGGMVGSLAGALRKLPILGAPRIAKKNLGLVAIEDLVGLLVELARVDWQNGRFPHRIVAASTQKMSFYEVLLGLKAIDPRARALTFQLPLSWFMLALSCVEWLKIPIGFRKDSLVSLVTLPEADDAPEQISFRQKWFASQLGSNLINAKLGKG